MTYNYLRQSKYIHQAIKVYTLGNESICLRQNKYISWAKQAYILGKAGIYARQ